MVKSCIIWICGPFPGSTHDLTIARSAVVHQLGLQEKALADKAYIGDSHFLTPYKPAITEEQKEFNRTVHQTRQKIERIIKRIKHFRCLKETWRHELELHSIVFTVCAQITNLCLMHEPLGE
jgi:hypothetical protein